MAATARQSHRTSLLLRLVALAFLAAPAYAAESPVVFSRTSLEIVSPPDKDGKTPNTQGRRLFSAEMRPYGFFSQPGEFFTRPLLTDEAYLEPITQADQRLLEAGNVFVPLDIAVADKAGTITAIYPSILLNALEEPIVLPESTAALLYVNGGRAELLGLKPGEQLRNALFSQTSPVIQ